MKPAKSRRTPDPLEAAATRAAETGAKHDAAILQSLREHVWRSLAQDGDPEDLSKIIALIIAARRQDLAEKNASNDGNQGLTDWLDQNVEPELRVTPEPTPNATAL